MSDLTGSRLESLIFRFRDERVPSRTAGWSLASIEWENENNIVKIALKSNQSHLEQLLLQVIVLWKLYLSTASWPGPDFKL